jgi:hypothetical protein
MYFTSWSDNNMFIAATSTLFFYVGIGNHRGQKVFQCMDDGIITDWKAMDMSYNFRGCYDDSTKVVILSICHENNIFNSSYVPASPIDSLLNLTRQVEYVLVCSLISFPFLLFLLGYICIVFFYRKIFRRGWYQGIGTESLHDRARVDW